ncbi:MAG: hypothetical protein ACK4N5_22910, partial [Myxococcales bacterium]
MRRTVAWLDEALKPIALAELRRGFRARLFSVALTLQLAACVLIALVGWSDRPRDGRALFVAFYTCAAVVCFWIIPWNTYRSVMRERDESTLALVQLTGMSAGRLLLGKIQSQLLQALVFGSAAAPFLLFSFLLQGISLPSVLLVLGGSALLQAFLTVVGAASATFYADRFRRNASNIGNVLFLGWITSVAVGLATAAIESGASDAGLLWPLGGAAWVMVSYGAIALAAAVGRLTFATDNLVYWTRLALLFHLCGSLAIAAALFVAFPGPFVGLVLGMAGLLHAYVAGLFLVGDRDGMSRRVRRNPPRLRLGGLLLPGARRGLWT